jgi:hypothetical protein
MKQAKIVMQRKTSDVDQVNCPSSPNLISAVNEASRILSGNQLQENIRKWLSPPDTSTNHNIACGTNHKKIAAWFYQGSIYREWKSTGSLLWVHGKRSSFSLFSSDRPTPFDTIL